jgi:regulator of replication initiation timing
MSISDTARDIARMASTAGLSKDVVDLMEKKLALLTGELGDAAQKIAMLEQENAELKKDVAKLQEQLDRAQPQSDRLPPESEQMLVVFANSNRGITSDSVI